MASKTLSNDQHRLLRRVKEMGTRSQVDCTWVPGDPDNRFGLYGPGH